LADVLEPDNIGIPKDREFRMTVSGSTVLFGFGSSTVDSLLATFISLMNDVQLFEEVWLLSHSKEAFGQRSN
jgi:hypothetical protein